MVPVHEPAPPWRRKTPSYVMHRLFEDHLNTAVMSTVIIIVSILLACIFLAWRDDKITDLEKRIEFLEQKINKKLVSRLLFVELKSVNSVLDTLNNCFYLIDDNGDYDIDSEYRLEDVTDAWWESLSKGELDIVNRIR